MAKKKQKPGKQKPPYETGSSASHGSARPADQIRTTTKPRKRNSSAMSQNRTLFTFFLVIKPLIFIGAVWALISFNKGYDRLYKYNFVKIYNDLEKYKGLSYHEKLKKMLPQDYTYLTFVNEETPADAVILAPPKEIWNPKDKKLGFGSYMHSKSYLAYFLYPRRILYDVKKDQQNPLMEEVTHVMIVDSWGYDKLPYEVSNPQPFAVMPIKR